MLWHYSQKTCYEAKAGTSPGGLHTSASTSKPPSQQMHLEFLHLSRLTQSLPYETVQHCDPLSFRFCSLRTTCKFPSICQSIVLNNRRICISSLGCGQLMQSKLTARSS